MRKFVKISAILSSLVVLTTSICVALFVGITYAKYSHLTLNEQSLSSPSLAIEILDTENRPLRQEHSLSTSFAKIDTLPKHVVDAFVSIEDKSFYRHHGVNFKRMIKAGLGNLKSHSLKEGASTISQQLIKNTHLSSEKTFERKIKEIVLTKKLEKSHSKDEILQSYLNVIYYGNNCYGIENAANYYFSKSAKDLTLQEGALIAGMIKSPSKYSPILKEENALARRNLVLSEMQKDGYITEEQALKAKSSQIELNLQTENGNTINSYAEAALDEASKILKMPAKSIALAGYKIHTYQVREKQESLKNALLGEDFASADHAGIVVDVKKHAVTAYNGVSAYKILEAKRQPGSVIKPILVYAPALNEDLISPSTQILDEPLALSDYCPKNADNKFHGYVSVSEAISKSINIPAIKVLSYVGIPKAKAYAESMGIEFDETDNSFALALGGMTYGATLKEIASAYSTFPNLGKFAEAKFVEYITDKTGKIVYHHKSEPCQVLREDCAFLMTSMLQNAAASGTAKALSDLSFPLAAKTGTVGKGKTNHDAWCVAYSPNEVCSVWVGNLNNDPISVAGGNQPTRCVKSYFASCDDYGVFTMPESVVEREIDLLSLENQHKVELAAPNVPDRFKTTALFSIFNTPCEVSKNFDEVPQATFNVKNEDGKVKLSFEAKRYVKYDIFDDKTLLKSISERSGPVLEEFSLEGDRLVIKSSISGCKDVKQSEFKIQKPVSPPSKKRWFV